MVKELIFNTRYFRMPKFLMYLFIGLYICTFQVADAAVVHTVKIYPTDDGVNLLYDDEQQTDWGLARLYTGQLARLTNTDAETVTLRSDNQSGFYRIYRGSLSFNTDMIPENATIQSATLNLYKYAFSNNHADTDVVITSHVRGNENILTQSDWYVSSYGDEFSRGILLDNLYTPYVFNQDGLSYIDTDGLTIFGALTEFDFDNNNPNVAPAGVAFYSSDAIGVDTDPFFEVTYTIPDSEPNIDELISELKSIIKNEIPKKSHRAVYLAQVRLLERLIDKEKIGAANVGIKILEKQIKHDIKRGILSLETAAKIKDILQLIRESIK